MLNNIAIDLYEDDEEEVENTGFIIDSTDKAEWAIRKVKTARQRRDLYVSTAQHNVEALNQKIGQAKEKCDSETSFLLTALDEFLNNLPVKETKTQVSFELPSGKLIRKKAKKEFEKTDDLLSYCEETSPEYVKEKTVKSVDWAEMKKHLVIENDVVINKETGEIVSGVNIVEKSATFEVK